MSLPRYQEYKDSRVSWLGEVPAHWNIYRLGYFFEERREKVSDKDFPPLSVTKLGIVPQLETAAKTDDGDNRKKVIAGDFVINSRSDRKGSSGAATQDGSVSLINTVLLPLSGIEIAYAHHLFRSVPFQEEFYRYGKGIVADLWSTNYSEMKNIMLAMPAVTEQAAIANFLDRETAKIDALIAEQEKLIALLAEKRQATISHAVTRGLNPNAPMKDSGVAWLGEVPAHWKVKKLRFLLQKNGLIRGPFGGDLKKEIFVENGIKVYEQKNAIYKSFELGSSFITPNKFSEMQKFTVLPGDYIMSCSGTIGKTFRIPDNAPPGIINQALLILRFQNCLLASFTDWLLIANFFSSQIIDNSQGGAMKNLVGMDIFTSISVPVPPTDEQSDIANHLSSEINQLDNLVSQSERGISLLQERRSALITAAVTGQIDVRGLVEPQPS